MIEISKKIKKIIVAILGLLVLSASASTFMQMVPQGVTNDYTALNITTGLGIDPTWEIRAHNAIQGGVSDAFSIWGGTSGSEDTRIAIDGTNGNVGIGTVDPKATLHISGLVYQDGLNESTYFGYEAGKVDDLSGGTNLGIGYQALYSNEGGYYNMGVGYQALYSAVSSGLNTAIGYQALYTNTTGEENTAVGMNSLYDNLGGNYNTAVGYYSLKDNTSGNHNTGVGEDCLGRIITGDSNTAIGRDSFYRNTAGSLNIGIGYQSGYYETGSNKLFIDNDTRSSEADGRVKALVYGVMAAAPVDQDLTINAELKLNGVLSYTQTPQTLTGAGAVDIVSSITHLVTTGADALTLVDGAEGQVKFIVMKTDGGNGTLTPTNYANGATLVFDDVGDSVMLLFTNGAWHWMGGKAT